MGRLGTAGLAELADHLADDRVEQRDDPHRPIGHAPGRHLAGMVGQALAQDRGDLDEAQETVRREAERYGVGIRFAELVGMIPQKALVDAARYYLQLDRMTDEQIIENRLVTL